MLSGKTALITGAARGIGLAFARAYLDQGARVAICDINLEAARAAAAGLGEGAIAVALDVTDQASIDACVDSVEQQFGGIDILINNAALFTAAPIAEIARADYDRIMAVNVSGTLFMMQAVARSMIARGKGGRIINNGSVAAHAPRAGSVAYTMSKHAVTGLTRSLSLDGRAVNIACGQIDVGNAATQLLREAAARDPDAEPVIDVATVADAVWHMATLPQGANVQFMTLMATNMPFIGRG